jgi:hypothetical protein
MTDIPFQTVDWSAVSQVEYKGETGIAYWRTLHFGDLRIRLVEYSPHYLADHWCQKGHIVHCLTGEVTTELKNGDHFVLRAGMSYVVSDDLSSHRSTTKEGATLLIIDGRFLGNQ